MGGNGMSIKNESKGDRAGNPVLKSVKTLGMEAVANENGKIISIKRLQSETKKSLSTQYKAARKELGVTQKDLEFRTGIAQPNITRFECEKCNPTLEMMIKMAAAINMKLEIKFVPVDNIGD